MEQAIAQKGDHVKKLGIKPKKDTFSLKNYRNTKHSIIKGTVSIRVNGLFYY
ncbi:MAG: hypothetical protein ACK504_12235 [Bacteroidota bacterium]